MDKVKQNIIQQQQLDKFNIEKSVVGTEAYYINQDIQKGMSQDEIIEKARSGVYKLTAENKKMGRVGQKYGESKKEEKMDLSQHSKQELLDAMRVRAKNGMSESHPEMKQLQEELDSRKESTEKKDEIVGSGDHKTKKSNLPENFSDVKSVLMAKTWLENKYGKDFKGSQLTDKEIDIYQDIKQKEKSGFYNYK